MAILVVMLNDEIKASAEYSEYLAKSKGSKLVKTRGKGLLTKQGFEIVVERVVDDIDSEETEDDDEEPLVRRRPTGVVIGEGSGVTPKVSDELTQKGSNEGSGATLAVPDEPKDGSSSSSSAFEDEIEDISKHIEDRGGNEQAGITQADVHVSEPQIEKLAATLIILKELVETKAQSMVDIPVQLAIPAEQIPLLVDTTVDTGAIDSRVTRLEKTVNATSRFNLLEAIDKSVKAHLKNVMPKDIPDFEGQDVQNDKRIQLEEPPAQKKRRRDDQDQDPPTYSEKKRNKKDADTSSSKKGQTQSKSSKSTKAPPRPSEAKKVVGMCLITHTIFH
ncbi:hypothetical protein Tco_1198515 [Tanacetum coccineum]